VKPGLRGLSQAKQGKGRNKENLILQKTGRIGLFLVVDLPAGRQVWVRFLVEFLRVYF
jgi:hypothetical protein